MKKKWLFAATMALAMTAFAVPAMAQDVSDETDFNNAITNHETEINLKNDITLTNPTTINYGVTINGNGHTITYSNTTQSYAFEISTSDAVMLQNVTVKTEDSDLLSGIRAQNCVPNITLDDVNLSVSRWGIAFNPSDRDGKLTVQNDSVIQNTRVTDGDYENNAAYGDYRGISLWDAKHATITVDDSTIQGFGYTINLAGTVVNGVRDFEGADINITDSKLMGWTAFNVWSCNTNFDITNSYLKGINNSYGPTDGFATIVVNDDIYNYGWGHAAENTFNIEGGMITNYRSGSASERLFRVDSDGITRVNFNTHLNPTTLMQEKVKIIDNTGDSDAVFYSGYGVTTEEWINYMNTHVTGDNNCALTGYSGNELAFIPA